MAKGFTKIGRGLYTDEKGNIGKLVPTGRGGWYIKSLDELPNEIKKDMTPSYKKDNEINRQIKQYYSMADDYNKEIMKLERQKNIERRINGELSSKYKEIEDLQAHKERIERDYRNSALKLEDARQRQVMNNEFGIAIKEKELNNIKQTGKINKVRTINKLNKGEAYQNKNGVVVEIKDIDDKGQTIYSMQTNPTTPPSYKTFMEKDVKSMLDKNGYTKVKEGTPLQSMADQRVHEVEETLYNDKTMLRYAKSKKLNGVGGMTTQELEEQIKQKEKYIRIAKGDKYLKEVDDRINSVETDISPMSEYSDTTGTGYSDKQYKELQSGAYDKRTSTELRKQLKALEPYTQELQVGDRVIVNTGGGRYGVRNKDDYDDPMTDYSAYVYGFNAKSIIERAREQGIIQDKPKKTSTEAKIERFKQRKQGATIDTMSKRELAEKIVENQISRGMNFTNKEEIIKDKMRMSKSDLLKYFK